MRTFSLAVAVAAAFLSVAPAFAHPKLVSATPAAEAVVAAPTKILLKFSERLVAQFSGAELFMTEMPGMKMKSPMRMGGMTTTVAVDGTDLDVSLAKPLPRGTYRLNYHVVSADTHRVEGGYVFKVK
jgi:methionine-rich copper-binding protein CopC